MGGFSKLHSSLSTSSLMALPVPTRWLWTFLLSQANAQGIVEGSIAGIAIAAHITLDECQAAFDAFLAPDPYSRTKGSGGSPPRGLGRRLADRQLPKVAAQTQCRRTPRVQAATRTGPTRSAASRRVGRHSGGRLGGAKRLSPWTDCPRDVHECPRVEKNGQCGHKQKQKQKKIFED
jgi:hypothetical protein